MVRKDLIFTHIIYGNPRTTSPLEGGINAQLRDLLNRQRGMGEEHRRRAAEGFLTLHELPLTDAIYTAAPIPTKPAPTPREEPDGPAFYNTALNPDESPWLRKGWAGRA